jgi:hypothetical protein
MPMTKRGAIGVLERMMERSDGDEAAALGVALGELFIAQSVDLCSYCGEDPCAPGCSVTGLRPERAAT